uniref:SDR family oxidoreductase n=1 Tax=Mesocestoides corti TaxID=53468 RepID=A0A5K3FIL9_MESCO
MWHPSCHLLNQMAPNGLLFPVPLLCQLSPRRLAFTFAPTVPSEVIRRSGRGPTLITDDGFIHDFMNTHPQVATEEAVGRLDVVLNHAGTTELDRAHFESRQHHLSTLGNALVLYKLLHSSRLLDGYGVCAIVSS